MIGVGDSVVCLPIEKRTCALHAANRPKGTSQIAVVKPGDVCRVTAAISGPFPNCDGPGLYLAGHSELFCGGAFRKVSPKSASKHIEDLKKLPERAREMEEL